MPVQDRHGIHENQVVAPATTEMPSREFHGNEHQQNAVLQLI
jgi:hypothetical protein